MEVIMFTLVDFIQWPQVVLFEVIMITLVYFCHWS